MRISIGLLPLATGCHLVFGQDPPSASGIDATADGVVEVPIDGPCTDPHDEDGDQFVDCFDNCPGTPNADQANAGETNAGRSPDTVGDACDPNPVLEGDRLVRFVTFAEPDAIDTWLPEMGGWAVSNDNLVTQVSTLPQYVFDTEMAPVAPYHVQFAFELDSVATNIPLARFSLVTDASDDLPPQSVYCGIARRMQSSPTDLVEVGSDSVGRIITSVIPYGGSFMPIEHEAELAYVPTMTGSGLTCSIRPIGLAQRTSSAPFPTPLPPGRFGFVAHYVAAKIHYVAIYQRAP